MKWFWWYFIVVVGVLLAGRVYLHQGFPYTHDGENHLARFANYKIALKEGQLPPRFAPNLQNKYGYPVFNYNYPLANGLSLPFSFFRIQYETTFKFIALIGLAVLAIGIQEWVRLLGVGRFGQFMAVGLVMSSPVVLNMTFFRGNIGEILSLALTATLLWLVERAVQHRTWHTTWIILSWIALLLAHNITAVYASGLIITYGVVRALQTSHWQTTIRQLLTCFAIAVAGSLWFWLPALAEKHLIVLDQANSINSYAQHFATLSQLFISPVQFGFSYPGSIDTLSLSVGVLTWLALALGATVFVFIQIARLIRLLSGRKTGSVLAVPNWFGWALLAGFSFIFIQTSASDWLWQLISPLQYAQFPWRFGLFVVLLAAPIAGWLISQHRWHWLIKVVLIIGLVVQIKTAINLQAVDYFHKTTTDYDAFSQTTSTQNENRTPAFRFESVPDWQPTAAFLSGEGLITTSLWRGSERQYTVEAKTSVVVVEPTMLFAGWQTSVNGQSVSYLETDSTHGRLAYQLEPGTYQVKSRFTQLTWPRIVGNSVSLLTFGWLSWQVLSRFRTKRYA
jgi:hypothetical protein